MATACQNVPINLYEYLWSDWHFGKNGINSTIYDRIDGTKREPKSIIASQAGNQGRLRENKGPGGREREREPPTHCWCK